MLLWYRGGQINEHINTEDEKETQAHMETEYITECVFQIKGENIQ